MGKVSREVAEADFQKWLDFKRVKEKKRVDSKQQEEELINAIEEGQLVVDTDFNLVLKLDFPLSHEGTITVSELKFKPRITVGEINAKLKGVSQNSADDRIVAYVSALTNSSLSVINKLEVEDYRIASSIVIYFL